MLTLLIVLALISLLLTVAAALNKCPVWIPVLFICVIELLQVIPLK